MIIIFFSLCRTASEVDFVWILLFCGEGEYTQNFKKNVLFCNHLIDHKNAHVTNYAYKKDGII